MAAIPDDDVCRGWTASAVAEIAFLKSCKALIEGYGPVRRYHASLIYVAGIKGEPMPKHDPIPDQKAQMLYTAGRIAALDEMECALVTAGNS